EVFKWERVRIWSRSQKTLEEFVASQQPKYPGFKISASRNLEEVVRGADVVVTVTPAREPLVKDAWITPGTHIAAIGADKGGDQELDPAILQRARIFVDDIRQCRTDGENQRSTRKRPHSRAGHRRRNRRGHHRQETRPALGRRNYFV